MSDEAVALWIAVEACAIAVVYTTFGALVPRGGWRWGVVIAAHTAIAAVAWAIAGRTHGLAPARLVLAAEALGAAGLGALGRRLVGDAALAAAGAALIVLAATFALPIVEAARPSKRVRTVAAAASPILAATDAMGVDALRLPSVYARSPSAVREMGTTWLGWTCLAWIAPATVQLFDRANERKRRNDEDA